MSFENLLHTGTHFQSCLVRNGAFDLPIQWCCEEDHLSFCPAHACHHPTFTWCDIYTVSKLLGHKHVVSNERYVHMTDKIKLEAINKLQLLNYQEPHATS